MDFLNTLAQNTKKNTRDFVAAIKGTTPTPVAPPVTPVVANGSMPAPAATNSTPAPVNPVTTMPVAPVVIPPVTSGSQPAASLTSAPSGASTLPTVGAVMGTQTNSTPAKMEQFDSISRSYIDYASPVPPGGMGMIPNFDRDKWIRPSYNYPWTYPTYSYPYQIPYQGTYPTPLPPVPKCSPTLIPQDCPACTQKYYYAISLLCFLVAVYFFFLRK